MSQSAFRTQYREETVDAFEQNYSLLRVATTQEAVIKGNTAVFLVAGSGNATAVTRGINGQLPFGVVDNTQLSCNLVEKHAPFETTDFNIFASQGDQKRIMQMASIATLNRDIDTVIVTELDAGVTQSTGTATIASVDLVERARVILGNQDVPIDEEDNIFAIITPAFAAYLRQTTEFSSGDYVNVKPYAGPPRRVWRWAGINWIQSTRITGKGTNSESCYMLHKNALGHAANSKEMEVDVGYERKQKNSWTNASLYHGAKTLQTAGIVKMLHDGSGYAAA